MAEYTSGTRVWHVNEVAGVASALVEHARSTGRSWRLRELPPFTRPLARAAVLRAADLVSWMSERRGADLLDIHYGPNAFYAWGSGRPYVLHLHGSDVRVDLHRRATAALTREGIRRADAVVYATQDLRDAVTGIRPDARWAPNPISPEVIGARWDRPVPGRVVFCSRWDATKGGTSLVDAAAELTRNGVEVHGLNWGELAANARTAGVFLHPVMPRMEFLRFMSTGALIVGQHSFGVPGMTELQAMTIGRPMVMQAPRVPVIQSTPETIVEHVLDSLADPDGAESIGREGQLWAIAHHSPEAAIAALEGIYREVLRTAR